MVYQSFTLFFFLSVHGYKCVSVSNQFPWFPFCHFPQLSVSYNFCLFSHCNHQPFTCRILSPLDAGFRPIPSPAEKSYIKNRAVKPDSEISPNVWDRIHPVREEEIGVKQGMIRSWIPAYPNLDKIYIQMTHYAGLIENLSLYYKHIKKGSTSSEGDVPRRTTMNAISIRYHGIGSNFEWSFMMFKRWCCHDLSKCWTVWTRKSISPDHYSPQFTPARLVIIHHVSSFNLICIAAQVAKKITSDVRL